MPDQNNPINNSVPSGDVNTTPVIGSDPNSLTEITVSTTNAPQKEENPISTSVITDVPPVIAPPNLPNDTSLNPDPVFPAPSFEENMIPAVENSEEKSSPVASSDIEPLPMGAMPSEPVSRTDTSNELPKIDLPPIVSPPPVKKRTSGRLVAMILGLLLLIGGVGAGVLLVQQNQDIREKAAGCDGPNNAAVCSGKNPGDVAESCWKGYSTPNDPSDDTNLVCHAGTGGCSADEVSAPGACGGGGGGGGGGSCTPPTGTLPSTLSCPGVENGKGKCILYHCPDGCSGGCGESTPGVWWEFGYCADMWNAINTSDKNCGQVDTVNSTNGYCAPSSPYCDSKIQCAPTAAECSNTPKKENPTPTPTNSPVPTPTNPPIITKLGCNQSCNTNGDCQTDLCISGKCRNSSCTNETDCTCPVATNPPDLSTSSCQAVKVYKQLTGFTASDQVNVSMLQLTTDYSKLKAGDKIVFAAISKEAGDASRKTVGAIFKINGTDSPVVTARIMDPTCPEATCKTYYYPYTIPASTFAFNISAALTTSVNITPSCKAQGVECRGDDECCSNACNSSRCDAVATATHEPTGCNQAYGCTTDQECDYQSGEQCLNNPAGSGTCCRYP